MPRFLLDSQSIGWAGAYFTHIQGAQQGVVDHGHERYCIQHSKHRESRQQLGSSVWNSLEAGVSVWQAGDEARFRWQGSGRSQFLFLAPEHAQAVLGDARVLGSVNRLKPASSRTVELIFDALQSDLALGSPAGPLVGDSLIVALIAQLAGADDARLKGRGTAPTCSRAIDLIEARFAEPLSLQALATASGLGVRQFSRAFRHETGQAPHQYLLQRRVEHAKQLIVRSLPLADVALQCGFCDQSQLSRTFLRLVGTTPGGFRARFAR
jgi:AraC-like DNA-binding protein